MVDIVNLITNNGIGIVCVAYLIYFQNSTMKEILSTLTGINTRLAIIEDRMEKNIREEENNGFREYKL